MDKESAFKHWINDKVVKELAAEIAAVYPSFNQAEFRTVAKKLPPLELKARVYVITEQLKICLPPDYRKALNIISKVLKRENIKGFSLWPISEFISQQGLADCERSVKVLYHLTKLFTAEFAIRPFLEKDHKKVFKFFSKWTSDESVHVRRWISEGSRPLLPWGQKLWVFINKPELSIALLNDLKFDEELYVRKSVANHLNDITKFKPDLVLKTLAAWQKAAPLSQRENVNWIIRHSLRTLIKKGDAKALKLIGISSDFNGHIGSLILSRKNLKVGEKIDFHFTIESKSSTTQKIVIDYKIHFLKSNGKISPKVFKLKTFEVKPKDKLIIKKSHSLKEISTMKFYPGQHAISIQVNGRECQMINWKLSF